MIILQLSSEDSYRGSPLPVKIVDHRKGIRDGFRSWKRVWKVIPVGHERGSQSYLIRDVNKVSIKGLSSFT